MHIQTLLSLPLLSSFFIREYTEEGLPRPLTKTSILVSDGDTHLLVCTLQTACPHPEFPSGGQTCRMCGLPQGPLRWAPPPAPQRNTQDCHGTPHIWPDGIAPQALYSQGRAPVGGRETMVINANKEKGNQKGGKEMSECSCFYNITKKI